MARSAIPTDFAGLCAMVRQVEGVRFQKLMEVLSPATNWDEMLRAVIAQALEVTNGQGAQNSSSQTDQDV